MTCQSRLNNISRIIFQNWFYREVRNSFLSRIVFQYTPRLHQVPQNFGTVCEWLQDILDWNDKLQVPQRMITRIHLLVAFERVLQPFPQTGWAFVSDALIMWVGTSRVSNRAWECDLIIYCVLSKLLIIIIMWLFVLTSWLQNFNWKVWLMEEYLVERNIGIVQ